jgi:cytochrome c oxidase cbb3-type subunit IV
MKFINYLESITGIGIYPLVSLLIFVVFFMLVTLYAWKADKNHISRLKNIPLNTIDDANEQIV